MSWRPREIRINNEANAIKATFACIIELDFGHTRIVAGFNITVTMGIETNI
jgi:hypothetical protein